MCEQFANRDVNGETVRSLREWNGVRRFTSPGVMLDFVHLNARVFLIAATSFSVVVVVVVRAFELIFVDV